MNPFVVLDLPYACSDAEVRARYQSLIKRYPPETQPEAFQLINEAYEKLRTERERWRWFFFNKEPPVGDTPLEVLEAFARLPGRRRPPGRDAFRQLLAGAVEAASSQAS